MCILLLLGALPDDQTPPYTSLDIPSMAMIDDIIEHHYGTVADHSPLHMYRRK